LLHRLPTGVFLHAFVLHFLHKADRRLFFASLPASLTSTIAPQQEQDFVKATLLLHWAEQAGLSLRLSPTNGLAQTMHTFG
jgi:hypothetical protein